ncbi:MAG: class I SAM-dependent methyltransferase, partial [Deltaproteobacteria bacterium]
MGREAMHRDCTQIRTIEDFEAYYKEAVADRLQIERKMIEENRTNPSWTIEGSCEWCQEKSSFSMDWQSSNGGEPNFRERMICPHCGLNSRQRFVASYLRHTLQERKEPPEGIYLYEQVTPFYRQIQGRLGLIRVTGSEYLGFDKKPGETIEGIRHEDALNLSFEDRSFDVVVSNDVYEHVPDIQRTFHEAARVLRGGGKLLFSIPFYPNERKTRQRASIERGEIVSSLPEQFHGNPLSGKGSLVFYEFGWDLLDFCKEAGFKDACMIAYYSLSHG